MAKSTRAPFGEADCESELKALKTKYSELYFDETPFNRSAIAPETYLIIGRRGSGKTALAQYFSFQKTIKDPLYIDVDEPAVYQQVLSDIAAKASDVRQIAIPRLKKVWEYVLWCVIFEHTKSSSKVIEEACDKTCSPSSVSHMINSIIDRLLVFFGAGQKIEENLKSILSAEEFAAAQREVFAIAGKRPIIIAFDTLEKHNVNNDALMNALAALVETAAIFNIDHRDRNIHLKIFMSGEIFPHLEEDIIQNPLKSIKEPVYLFWRPRDLLRLISWRFFNYLKQNDLLSDESHTEIRWDSYQDVLHRMWVPYFGAKIDNTRGFSEDTFPYVLRHTQMRPRQLILLCNAIARKAQESGTFPLFAEVDIRSAIREAEKSLANEIINSFSEVYPNVNTIVDSLMKIPKVFNGNELDKRASQSASQWPPGTYSPAQFRRLVAELGIVGLVRRHDEEAGYVEAEFEYSIRDRLPVTHRDQCAIHPMFYSRLNVEFNSMSRVMPYPPEPVP